MGTSKYVRKCGRRAMSEEAPAAEVAPAVGVRTRSRSAAAAGGAAVAKVQGSKKRKALPPPVDPAVGDTGEVGSRYIQLRSRTLFMSPPPAPAPVPAPRVEAAGAARQGAALAAGLSHCSSTASADAPAPASSDATEAGGEDILDGSPNNSESSRDIRDRRETTPSSHQPTGEVSDMESSLAGRKIRGSSPARAAAGSQDAAGAPRMPSASEFEEYFAAEEEAMARRFAAKYNFDIVRGVPLDGGRFEWTPVTSRH